MTNRPTVILSFRARGYSNEEREELAERLASVADVTLRPFRMYEAGGSAELWAVIEFAGLAVAGGVIGNLATDGLKSVCHRLADWWSEKSASRAIPPEVCNITIRLAEATIEVADELQDRSPDVYFMSGEGIRATPDALFAVLQVLPPEFMREADIRYIRINVPSHPLDADGEVTICRYWQLGIGAAEPTHLLDSWYGTVGELPKRPLRPLASDPAESP